jgi:tetratricopeptide (TPR) repeat protein
MPRWLSEGISVYEERQENPAWGQSMNPRYRELILAGELTPVSQLSAAFLNPASPAHLQFAYYESSLVVEFLVERYGRETLQRILTDLGCGVPINELLEHCTGSLELLDREFAQFARARAEGLAPDADWRRLPLPPATDAASLADWNMQHPNNFWGLQRYALRLLSERKWEAAQAPLKQLLALYPGDVGPNNAYRLLAAAHRELGETDRERAVLDQLASLDADAADVYLRLMELQSAAEDWEGLVSTAERMLAVNPLVPAPHRHLARAAEELARPRQAINAYRALLQLAPVDPAEVHYRLACLLQQAGDLQAARRHVLQALEQAPRFRAAHRTLLQVFRAMEQSEDEGKDQ